MARNPYEELPQVSSFTLESSLIADGETMPGPQRSGIFGEPGGEDTSPDLSWSGFPAETKSFLVTMYDPDAPTPSGFWHWTAINIPASVTSLQAGAGGGDETLPAGAKHLINDASLRGYLGAAPPPGDPPHHYFVAVAALDVADVGIVDTATPALAFFQTRSHTLARAVLVPVYGA